MIEWQSTAAWKCDASGYESDLATIAAYNGKPIQEIDQAIVDALALTGHSSTAKGDLAKTMVRLWEAEGGRDATSLTNQLMSESTPAPQGNRAQRRHPEKKTTRRMKRNGKRGNHANDRERIFS